MDVKEAHRPADRELLSSFAPLLGQEDTLVSSHEPVATRDNPVEIGPYIRAFEEDGSWVVEKDRDPTFEAEVGLRVMKLLTYFDHVDPERIRPTSRFVEDLGLDSLDVVEFQLAIEEEFGVKIPDDLAEGLWSVGDAVRILCNEDRVWGPYKEENIQKWGDWWVKRMDLRTRSDTIRWLSVCPVFLQVLALGGQEGQVRMVE